MIKVVLIDDEPGAIKSLTALINKHCPELEIAGTANNIHDGYQLIRNENPALIFLDINMPNGTGLDLVEQLQGHPVAVIFTTAHQEYAIKAIRLSAVDYLLKPINYRELKEAIEHFKEAQSQAPSIQLLKELIAKPNKLERIAIPNLDGIQIVDTKDIYCIMADSNYSIFQMKDDQKVIASKPIGDYEKLLDTFDFLRIHRSYIVNLNEVKKYSKRSGTIVLSNGLEIDVARTKKQELMTKLANML